MELILLIYKHKIAWQTTCEKDGLEWRLGIINHLFNYQLAKDA